MAEIEFPTYKISDKLLADIESAYKSFFGKTPQEDSSLGNAIQWTSDFYISNPSAASPWKERAFQKSYLAYYLVMNNLRSQGVVQRLNQVGFFDSTSKIVEWGSGNGAFSLALENKITSLDSYTCIEISELGIKQHKELQNSSKLAWHSSINSRKLDTLIFSYSFTELDELPNWAFQADKILIMEPSTHQDSRRLMGLREKFISLGYNVWAPCTHQESCPLLAGSAKDWCHDNYDVTYPEYLIKATSKIKIQLNRPATSYLAVSKSPINLDFTNKARVTGNTLKERGKTRQMLCRNSDREFMSWFPKRQEVPHIPRGSLVTLPEDIEKKSNELRTKKTIKIED